MLFFAMFPNIEVITETFQQEENQNQGRLSFSLLLFLHKLAAGRQYHLYDAFHFHFNHAAEETGGGLISQGSHWCTRSSALGRTHNQKHTHTYWGVFPQRWLKARFIAYWGFLNVQIQDRHTHSVTSASLHWHYHSWPHLTQIQVRPEESETSWRAADTVRVQEQPKWLFRFYCPLWKAQRLEGGMWCNWETISKTLQYNISLIVNELKDIQQGIALPHLWPIAFRGYT